MDRLLQLSCRVAFFFYLFACLLARSGCSAQALIVTAVGGPSQEAVVGQVVTLQFNVTPSVLPQNIVLRFNGIEITEAEEILFLSVSDNKQNVTLNPAIPAHEGIYILTATSGSNSSSASIYLEILAPPGLIDAPEDAIKHEGESVVFECFATGEPTPTVQWIFHGQVIDTSNSKYDIGEFGSSDFGSLTVYNLTYDDHGVYTCNASNLVRTLLISAELFVQQFPVITIHPENSTAAAGGVTTLNCSATGFPSPDILWMKNGTAVSKLDDDRFSAETTMGELLSVSVLTLNGPVLSDNGLYSCNATNMLKTLEVITSVDAELFIQYPPSVTVSNETITVNQTDSVSFSCEAFGIPPPQLRWVSSKNVSQTLQNTSAINIQSASFKNASNFTLTMSSLQIDDTTRSDHEANFTCVGENGVKNYITSPESATTELIVQVPPTVVFPAVSPVLGLVKGNITITFVIEDASPTVRSENIKWTFQSSNGSDVTILKENTRYLFSANNLSLTISDVTHSDEGYYTIMAVNEAGSDTLKIRLDIEAASEIIAFSGDINVLEGDNATLMCSATSEPTHTVQWFKDGVQLNHTEKYSLNNSLGTDEREVISTLVVANVNMSDTGNYTCQVSNIHGSQSETAHLEVQIIPRIVQNPNNTIGIFADTSTLFCSAFGSPVPSIDWLMNGIQLNLPDPYITITSVEEADFTMMSYLEFTNLSFGNAGIYVCRASNNLSTLQNTDSDSATLTVNHPPVITNFPASLVRNETQNVNLTCVVFGLPKPTVMWSRFDLLTIITTGSSKFIIYTVNSSLTTGGMEVQSTLQIDSVNGSDTGNYTCTAVNQPLGADEPNVVENAVLYLLVQTSPRVSFISNEIEIGVKGRSITLSITVTGDEPKVRPEEIRWYLNNSEGSTEIMESDQRITFSNDRFSLTITNLSLLDEGNYNVSATNIIGTDLSMIFLDVEVSPVIMGTAGNVTQVLGRSAVFHCSAVSEPVHITDWTFNSAQLTNSSKYLIQGQDTVNSTLTVFNVSLNDEGSYSCNASNVHGVDFASASLRVQVPPEISTHPPSSSKLVTTNANLTCCATGLPLPEIRWIKGTSLLDDSLSQEKSFSQSAICSSLLISNLKLSDIANYTCNASNVLAEVLFETSTAALLTVLYPPEVFPFEMAEYTKNESDSFTLECVAFGIPLPQLFWIPAPLISIETDQKLLLNSDVALLLQGAVTTRFDNVSTLCPTVPLDGGSSGNGIIQEISDDGNGGAEMFLNSPHCVPDSALNATNCSLPQALCPVSCGVNIENSVGIDKNGRTASVSHLTICSLEKVDELSYSCLAVNDIRNDINTSEATTANLIVQVAPEVSPANNQSQLAFRDRNTTLEFIIERASPNVKSGDIDWILESDRLNLNTTISANNGNHYKFTESRRSLTIFNLTINDTGRYTLVATNPAGMSSDFIDLDIQAFPDLEIISEPQEVVTGTTVELRCFAEGSPLQNVKWEFTDVYGNLQFTLEYIITDPASRAGTQNITFQSSDIDISSIEEQYKISQPDDSIETRLYGMLTIANITAFQAGQYRCTLTNIHNTDSYSVSVDVQLYPRIVEGPSVTECTAGGPCNLTCFTEGVPSPDVTWFQNGLEIAEGDLVAIATSPSYSTANSTILFDNIFLEQAGNYNCRASNVLVDYENATSSVSLLTVNYPAEVIEPVTNSTGNESSSASLVCVVAGIPQPWVSWTSLSASGGPLIDIVEDSDKYIINEIHMSGDQGLMIVRSELIVLNLNKIEDEMLYQCDGSNNVPNLLNVVSTSKASLTVQVPPSVSALVPKMTFIKGNDILVSFQIDGAFPLVKPSDITWIHNGVVLNTSCLDCEPRYNFTEGLLTLNITNLQVSDDGEFMLRARNPAGYDNATTSITVHVTPAFNTTGQFITVNDSDRVELKCTADGIPRPTIGWFHNDIFVNDEIQATVTILFDTHETFREDIIGENGITSTLTNTATDIDEAGTYVCRASNDAGDVFSEPYELEVNEVTINHCEGNPCDNGGTCFNQENGFTCQCGSSDGVLYGGPTCEEVTQIPIAPMFTQVPERKVVDLFEEVILNCKATGQPTPLISWFKDKVNIPMQHSDTYVINEVQLNDRGNYTCVAENSVGKIESPPALINVQNVVQYSAQLTVPASIVQTSDRNLSDLAQDVIDNINQFSSGQQVEGNDNTTFYFIEINGNPVDNGDNITIPILLTILAEDRPTEELRTNVQNSLVMFNDELELANFEESGVTRFNYCPPETTRLPSPDGNPQLDLQIDWPETLIGEEENIPCPCGFSLNFSSLIARRTCGGDFVTGAVWLPPDVTPCEFSVLARRICRLALLNDTAERVTELRNITEEDLGATEVTVTVAAMDSTVVDTRGNLTTTNLSLDVIDNVALSNRSALMESQRDGGTSSRLQDILFNLTQSLPVEDSPIMLMKQTFAISIENRQPNNLGNISSQSLDPRFPMSSASFPTDLDISDQSFVTSFSAFADDALFLPRDPGQKFVTTSVLDFTIQGIGEISNLPSPVNLSFARSDVVVVNATGVRCSFWDPRLDGGFGNWSTSGCMLVGQMNTSATNYMCQCNHLTSFAVLLDVSPEPRTENPEDAVFEIFTYIGLTVSIVSLCIVIFTYLFSAKLRQSDANKVLLNLCFAILGLDLTFILAAQGTKLTEPLCAIVGALLQYFFLVNFIIMAAESVDLFIKLVIVLGPKIQYYVLKVMLLSWITPLFIVIFSFAPYYGHYVSSTYCGAKGVPFYVGVLVPFVVIYIFNWTVFLAIMFSLIRKSQKKLAKAKSKQRASEVKQQLRIAITVSVLFGLGWGFALGASTGLPTAVRIIFNAIFTVLVAFQGFFIFLLYVVFSPSARKEWRRWILRKEAKKRGYTETSTSGHHHYGHSSKRTTGSTSLNSGTLRKQVLSSSAFKPTMSSSAAAYSTYESSVMDTHAAALEELRMKMKQEEDDDFNQTYLNPLDLGELVSLGGDGDDAKSLIEETTFTLPMSPPSQALEQEDEDEEDEEEAGESGSKTVEDHSKPIVSSTFTNPFLRKSMRNPNRGEINPSEDTNLLSSPGSDEENDPLKEPSSNGHTSISLNFSQLTASQGFTQSSFGDETVLIHGDQEISKL